MQYNYDYFISYAHKDNQPEDGKPGFVDEFVRKLKNSSEHHQIFGEEVSVFFDKSEIHNMSDWDNRIRSSLASSRFFVALLSPNYFHSEYCAREFDWWMQHEMHRCTLGEGTAPILIVDVARLQDSNSETIPDIPPDLQVRFPNWLKQIRKIQSDLKFDMHDFLISKIDDVLKTLRDEVKDKVRHQEIVDILPYDTYPGYNENFVGRRENLLSLRDYISTKAGKVICALTGLGGFGKTELALTYGHAFGWDYRLGRFFKPCENFKSVYEAILGCGIQAKYGWKLRGTIEEQLTALFDNLKAERDRIIRQNAEIGNLRTEGAHILLILDNVNNLNLITQLLQLNLPEFIHVIITTRENTSAFTNIYSESIERLGEDETVELLNNLRLFDNPAEAEAARKIAQLLAGYTLIVELTGAYLARNRKNPLVTYQSQYERLVKDHAETFRKMADKTGDLTRHAAETVAAVMKSTLSAISSNTRKALKFASLMAPDAVALGWLPELCGQDEEDGIEILNELTGYNLLTPLENEPNIARIHRLVAETVKQEIPKGMQKGISYLIQKKCNELLHKDETFWYMPENSWNITPVSEFCLALSEQWAVETSEEDIYINLTWALGASEGILNSLGKMNEARVVFQRLFKMYEERAKTFPESVTAQLNLSVSYNKLGDWENAAGNAAAARECYEKSLEIRKRLADKMPNDFQAQRNLSISYECLGDLERAAGNAAVAREWYEKKLAIDKKLVNLMSDNVDFQRNLSISYERLGDLERTAGNSAAAREWYEKALEITLQLAEKMPDNVDAQRDLSISYNKLGDWERVAGNAAAAREWYEKKLVIDKMLVVLMPDNVDAQRNLSISYNKLGDLEHAAGNAVAARDWYEKDLRISKRLANLMPDNVTAQRDLSISYNKLGDLERAAGNVAAARDWYEKALKITQRLVEIMPDNITIQRDLSVLYERLGDFEKDAGNASATQEWYKKLLENCKLLAEQMPDNVDAQRDLSASYNNLGNLEIVVGNTAAARDWYEKTLEISKRLADKMPERVTSQRDLSEVYFNLGSLEFASNNAAKAKEWCNKALTILEQVINKIPDNVESQMILGKVYRCLGDSENADGNIKIARDWYEKSLNVLQQLATRVPDNVQVQKDLADTQKKLDQLQKLS